ncbi:hypothetical protein ACFFIX_16615 [Metabacillus herbersteinensis]|uniref:HTH cro/C1-type domain-containing protein n=1 Tax=Metabacillus herbersteinensis TaxID=283816 RepID=A0ABV6GH84_9BACI
MSYELLNFGETLWSLRVYKGMDISDLAEDICSEEDFILFEKDRKSPTLEQLYKISIKLNIEISDFFGFTSAGSIDYVSSVYNLIKKYKRDRNYQAINVIIEKEKDNPLFKPPSRKQFLMWHEAICSYYLAKVEIRDKEVSIKKLYEAIELTNPSKKGLSEREIEILMSISLLEKDDSNFDEAIILLNEVLKDLDRLPSIIDTRVQLRALFGLSQSLSKVNNFEESLNYSLKGIDQCINNEDFYLFGEFLYQTGLNYINLGNLKKGKEYYTKSIQAFELQGNEKLSEVVKEEIEKVLN